MTALAGSAYDQLIAELDLATKVRLLTGATAFTLAGEPSIGLTELAFSDGPTGVRGLKFTGGEEVALFPNATLLSAAWSEEAAFEVGRIVADEAERQEIHVVLGPTINLHRSVLGGRLFEAYSEDPLLTGKLAAGYVRGVQSAGIGACLKHLVANESETGRHWVNSVVDEATLRELYLLPFEIAIEESDAWTLMAAYNDVNGQAATEQVHVNTEIVKGEWGYSGLIMSDWFATKTVAPAANGGLDLVMPGPQGPWGEALVAAVRSGEVDERVVDDHVRRLLHLAERTGALGTGRQWRTELPAPGSAVRREQFTRLAAAGITVLRNENDTLPLTGEAPIALIGRHAVDTICMGGGSAQVNPPYQISIAQGLNERLPGRVRVVDGVEVRSRGVAASPAALRHPVTGEAGVQILLETADGRVIQERHEAEAKTMVGFDDDLTEPVARVRFRARAAFAGRAKLGVIGSGGWTITVGTSASLVTLRTDGTAEVGTATGARGEAGHMVDGSSVLRPSTWTFQTELGDQDLIEASADISPGAWLLGLVAEPAKLDDDSALAAAVEAARTAEVAIVVVGLTEEEETESVDKSTLELPGRQDELVRAVAAVARRTVVVVNAATPILMPWLDAVDAVLWAGLPGQEGGHAVAAVLVGDLEPAGRLVTTFPAADGWAPAWEVTPHEGDLVYSEGRFIGYRGHAAGHAPAPAFWFGHGLGYGTWEYEPPVLLSGTATPTLSVAVRNTSPRASREVVQVYLRPNTSSEPVRLVGWQAVDVPAGGRAEVTVSADPRLLRRWDSASSTWATLGGGGEFLVARGLGDIRGQVAFS